MARVDIRSVDKLFGRTQVLFGVDIGIEDTEFIILVGPSGCGKSTLLRMIAGLEKINAGEIAIGGRIVNNLEPKERDVAMVFQNYALYPHMTVFDNLGFSLKIRKTEKSVIDSSVREAAGILKISEFFKRFPRQLSGGQRQRVAMGRALVRAPQVFLFDEPLSNLDAKLRVQMRTEIKALHRRLKTTTIYVTHDQIEAMTMADRIVVLNDGRVEQIGQPLEVYDRPVNMFVAEFIGSPSINFFPGVVRRPNGGLVVEAGDGTRLPLPPDAAVAEGDNVVYGIRPEHLELSDDESAIPVTIGVVEPTGFDTLVFSEVAGVEVCAHFTERYPLSPGQQIRLAPRLEYVHLFEADTGNRIQ